MNEDTPTTPEPDEDTTKDHKVPDDLLELYVAIEAHEAGLL